VSIPPVSNSELGTFTRCRRKWYLIYVLWVSPFPDQELPVGSKQLGLRIHQAFEADEKSTHEYGPLHWLEQIYGAELLTYAYAADELEKEHALARVMMKGYLEWAAENGLDEGIEIIAAERDVQVPMPRMPDVMLRGRLDQMIRRRLDGAVLFRDWKTTGNLSAANDLPLSPQMKYYTMLQRLSEDDVRVEGGQVVYLLRSKRTARATPPFYHLEEVRYDRDTLNSTYLRTKEIILQMITARERLNGGIDHRQVVYPTPDASCSWSCPFYTMCPLMDSEDRWQDMAKGEFTQADPAAYYSREIPGVSS
jgi:hypothetical protein